MTRKSRARLVVFALAGLGAVVACKEKPPPPPAANPYQVGSIIVNLPASVKIPMPQGRPDEPGVNTVKCTYAVDRKVSLMVHEHPEYKDQLTQAKPSVMQECLQKWTQQEYDCIVAAKVAADAVMCNRFRKPLSSRALVGRVVVRSPTLKRSNMRGSWIAVVAFVIAPVSAWAQGAPPAGSPPPPPPPPGAYAYPPPPPGYYPPPPGGYAPPPVDPSIHNHDGFYLRMGLGGGYVSDTETLSIGSGSAEAKITGGGVIGEFMLGGTPGRGVVIGGGLQFGSFPSPTVKTADGTTATGTNATLNVSTIGPFVDYYFDPSQGLHLQALVGYGVVSASNNNNNSSSTRASASGLALSIGFGDEWWVGEQWSIGVLARLQYVNAKRTESALGIDITDTNSVIVPGLLATFTNH